MRTTRPWRLRAALPATTALVLASAATAAATPPGARVLHEHREPGSYYGWAVSELADVDGDGATDLIVGGIAFDGYRGVTEVRSGRTGALLHRFEGAHAWALEGYAIADVGDVDADGVHDIATGAPDYTGLPGTVSVHSGRDGSLLHRLTGEAPGDFFGAAVGDAGDVDADGHADILIGATQHDGPAGEDAGRAYVVSGATGATLTTFDGTWAGGQFGSATDGTGDLNGNGSRDIIVGAYDAGAQQRGEVTVFDPRAGDVIHLFEADPRHGESLGYFFVAGVGDVDGDGIDDLYASDFDEDTNRGPDTGRGYVWSGATGETLHRFKGKAGGAELGPGRGAGDVDGDGHADLIVGSWLSGDGGEQAGRIDVFSGRTGDRIRTIVNETPGEQFGFDAVGLGDVDGDGRVDFVVSAANGDAVYVIAGK